MRDLRVAGLANSIASSFKIKVIWVPRPRVFPRGSSATVKVPAFYDVSHKKVGAFFFFWMTFFRFLTLRVGLPDILDVIVVLGGDNDIVSNQKDRVETDTKLTNQRHVTSGFLEMLQKLGGSWLGDGTKVLDQLLLGHSNTSIGDCQDAVLFIGFDSQFVLCDFRSECWKCMQIRFSLFVLPIHFLISTSHSGHSKAQWWRHVRTYIFVESR